MYYNPQFKFKGSDERAYWFERMKGNHKDQILRGAANVAGGRGENNDNRTV